MCLDSTRRVAQRIWSRLGESLRYNSVVTELVLNVNDTVEIQFEQEDVEDIQTVEIATYALLQYLKASRALRKVTLSGGRQTANHPITDRLYGTIAVALAHNPQTQYLKADAVVPLQDLAYLLSETRSLRDLHCHLDCFKDAASDNDQRILVDAFVANHAEKAIHLSA